MTDDLYIVPTWRRSLEWFFIVCGLLFFPILYFANDWRNRTDQLGFLEIYSFWILPIILIQGIFWGLAIWCKKSIQDRLTKVGGSYGIRASDANGALLAKYHAMAIFGLLAYTSCMALFSWALTAVFLTLIRF